MGNLTPRRLNVGMVVLLIAGAMLLASTGISAPALAMQAATATPGAAAGTVTPSAAVTGTVAVTATNPLSPTIPAPVAVAVDPKTTAYLVLDVTSTICSPRPSCVATLGPDAALLKKARDAGALVVYSDTGGTSTILPEVAQGANEQKVTGRADKFIGTNLDDILKGKGIKTVVIVGYVANGAVLYTTFGANIRGYTAVVAIDGTGAEDPFAYLLTRYQLLNEPGFANPQNAPLSAGKVTLSRSDLITFSAAAAGTVTAPVTGTVTTPAAGATPAPTQGASGAAPPIPGGHAGRTQCLVCHATGVSGAPKVPSVPDHSAMKDDVAVCATCHAQAK